jgi:cell shape-determining protein MreC
MTMAPPPVGRRFQSVSDFAEITTDRPERALTRAKPSSGGRNVYGRLSELLGMPAISGLRTIPARVVSAGTGLPGATLLLDRGSDAGVAPGMPVTGGGALIGRVIQGWSSTAAVLPVTDPASAVGVRLSGSGVLAVAEGRGRGTVLRLEPLDPSSTPAPDETAVTAGLRHGLYPAGLVVGRAAGGDGLRLLTGLDRLHFVQVLDWRPPR